MNSRGITRADDRHRGEARHDRHGKPPNQDARSEKHFSGDLRIPLIEGALGRPAGSRKSRVSAGQTEWNGVLSAVQVVGTVQVVAGDGAGGPPSGQHRTGWASH